MRARQRKERDISSLSAEMRQMEEQYVSPFHVLFSCSLKYRGFTNIPYLSRFTPYDFKKMHRRSYYPQTQIISTVTAASSSGPASRPVTPMTIANDGVQDYPFNQKQLIDENGMNTANSPVVEMADMSEKIH